MMGIKLTLRWQIKSPRPPLGCQAYARRGFAGLYKLNKYLRAAMAVKKIAGLYRLEKKVGHIPADKIRQ